MNVLNTEYCRREAHVEMLSEQNEISWFKNVRGVVQYSNKQTVSISLSGVGLGLAGQSKGNLKKEVSKVLLTAL